MNSHAIEYARHLRRCFPQRSGTTIATSEAEVFGTAAEGVSTSAPDAAQPTLSPAEAPVRAGISLLLPAMKELLELRLDEADRRACGEVRP